MDMFRQKNPYLKDLKDLIDEMEDQWDLREVYTKLETWEDLRIISENQSAKVNACNTPVYPPGVRHADGNSRIQPAEESEIVVEYGGKLHTIKGVGSTGTLYVKGVGSTGTLYV